MTQDSVSLRVLTGNAIAPAIGDLAQLRLRVFHDWPYIYDGDADYERKYLEKYVTTQGAAVIVAEDAGRIVGASTALPLAAAEASLQAPFAAAGEDVARWYYFGESVLLPDWRGRGIGVAFFNAREEQARLQGFAHTAFCAVDRPAQHPLKPADYAPLDAFWAKRGYTKTPQLQARLSWRDIGDAQETEKTLTFWVRRGTAA